MTRGRGFRTETQRIGAACGCVRAIWRRSASLCSIVAAGRERKTTQGGFYYGDQFWLNASSISDRQVDWIAARGQGGHRLLIVPTFDLVAVVTAGNYYGNDRLASLVPQTVLGDYVLPSVDARR